MIKRERVLEILKSFESLRPIAVVGDVGIDKYTIGEVSRISPEAPVPVLHVTRSENKLAMAANVTHNLSSLRVSSSICGVVGVDSYAQQFKQLLQHDNINLDPLLALDSRPTIVKERITTSMQQICRIDYEVTKDLTKEEEEALLEKVSVLARNHGAIIIEDYSKGVLTERVLQKVIDEGRKSGAIVAVDPGRNTPPEFYKGATLFKPNFVEAKQIVAALGHRTVDPKEMAEILLRELELQMVVITLGKDGMALSERGASEVIRIPTVATEVFDVSGAGDTTISLITASLLAGANLLEAAWMGTAGAGVVIAKRGTATVDQEELLDYFDGLEKRLLRDTKKNEKKLK